MCYVKCQLGSNPFKQIMEISQSRDIFSIVWCKNYSQKQLTLWCSMARAHGSTTVALMAIFSTLAWPQKKKIHELGILIKQLYPRYIYTLFFLLFFLKCRHCYWQKSITKSEHRVFFAQYLPLQYQCTIGPSKQSSFRTGHNQTEP